VKCALRHLPYFAVGCVGASGKTFKTWLVFPVLAMYPLSLAFVCFLDFFVGLK